MEAASAPGLLTAITLWDIIFATTMSGPSNLALHQATGSTGRTLFVTLLICKTGIGSLPSTALEIG